MCADEHDPFELIGRCTVIRLNRPTQFHVHAARFLTYNSPTDWPNKHPAHHPVYSPHDRSSISLDIRLTPRSIAEYGNDDQC
jgi:hypothetical protein